jgi:tRNA nucleotidyltransferase (CCA-adding enzyme)
VAQGTQDTGERILARLQGRPGAAELLALADETDELALVGGAVRDLLLERDPHELDVVVAGDAALSALQLAGKLGVEPTIHERFGTASVIWAGGRIDIATQREETYPAPGSLPDVRPGSAQADLQRRDFTVNAIALALGRTRRGELRAVPNALEDLSHGVLRVLHEASFSDDPTRLLRLARYAARLGFEAEPVTAGLARDALKDGALGTVSGARLGSELRLALAEPDPLRSMRVLSDLGLLDALGLSSPLQGELLECALSLLPADGEGAVVIMASLAPRAALLDELEFAAAERDRIDAAARLAPLLADQLSAAGRPSELHALSASASAETVALAGALAAADGRIAGREAASEWLTRLRHVRLSIDGNDLIAAGVSAGPEVGARLTMALRRLLDGEIEPDSTAELAAAMGELA